MGMGMGSGGIDAQIKRDEAITELVTKLAALIQAATDFLTTAVEAEKEERARREQRR